MNAPIKLDQAFEQLHALYKALSALRDDVLPRDPKLFILLAEGPLSQIRQLQQQIDEYTGVDVVRSMRSSRRVRK